MSKIIECTGSPKNAGFSTKEVFLSKLSEFGISHGKMTKKNNVVDVLATDSIEKSSNKMLLAKELGIEIMTYEDLAEAFSITGDL